MMGVPLADLAAGSRPVLGLSALASGDGLITEYVSGRAIGEIEADIRALEGRSAEPNAFAGADFLLAASRHFVGAGLPDFIAIRRNDGSRELVGLFSLARHRLDFPPGVLRSWQHPFAGFGAPLIDRGCIASVLAVFIAHLQQRPDSAAAMCFSGLAVRGPIIAGLQLTAAALGLTINVISAHERATLEIDAAAFPPTDRRSKERRRQRRRLAERGELTFEVAHAYEDVRAALESFLALEARGWKGRNGTALLNDPAQTNFSRAMVWSAARRGAVRIAELRLDDAPIASTILLSAGGRGFLWKIAFDDAYAGFSPGVLLALDLKRWLYGQIDIALADSCAAPGHPMIEALWPDRIAIADVMVSLHPSREPHYRSTLAREQLRRSLRARVKTIYHRMRGRVPANG